jgi:hypothetical protein
MTQVQMWQSTGNSNGGTEHKQRQSLWSFSFLVEIVVKKRNSRKNSCFLFTVVSLIFLPLPKVLSTRPKKVLLF